MAKSLSSKEVLIYLYDAKKGNWEDIYKAISTKEELPADIDACRAAIDTFSTAYPQFMTLVDDGFPKALKNRKHPPFVVPFSGNSTLALVDQGHIVALEDGSLSGAFLKHGINHAYLDDHGVTFVVPKIDPKTGEYNAQTVSLVDDREHSIYTLISACVKFIATSGAEDFAKEIAEKIDNQLCFAIPGNSGCACNQLIKSGWKLCDTINDVKFDD